MLTDIIKSEIKKEIGYEYPSSARFIKNDKCLRVQKQDGELTVHYKKTADLMRAALIAKANAELNEFCVEEVNEFNDLCYMVDCSRNAVVNIPTVKKLMRNMAMLGYNSMMLYTEDTYEVDGEPILGYLRGRYTQAELKELNDYGAAIGIELIPCVQTLAHFDAIANWWYAEYTPIIDSENVLLVGDERVYKLIDNIFATLAKCFTTRRCHIGMDEAHAIGRGKYMDLHGYRKPFDILLEHLNRVSEIAKKYGFDCIMWSDMFWKIAYQDKKIVDSDGTVHIPPEILQKIPDNVHVSHWHYTAIKSEEYERRFKTHGDFPAPVWFAASSWSCIGYCPATGFAFNEMDLCFSMMKKYGIRSAINCAWGDEGAEASWFSILPQYSYFTAKALNKNMSDVKREFFALTNYDFDDFKKIAYPNDCLGKYDMDYASPTKIHLYSDLFLGTFERDYTEEQKQAFTSAAKILKQIKGGQYEYLFDTIIALSELLEIKYGEGLKIRAAYEAGDKEALRKIALELGELGERVKSFYGKNRVQWFKENKPHGFDVIDYRLGGLIARVAACKDRLEDYVSGKIDKIDELHEQLLPADVFLARNPVTGRMTYNSFHLTATVNRL